ncbi:hypothetical protein Tco_0680910, partial [Tanacetum coccineum]
LKIRPLVSSERIDEFNLINEASLSEYDEEIISRFNDLFNIIYPDDSKSEKDNDDNDIGIIQSSEVQFSNMAPLPAADHRHPWLRYQIEEVDQEILAPAQAPPPAPQPRTMSQRIERIEEEVHDLRRDVVGLRGVVESFTTEESRVSTWLITCMTQLMDASGQTYQPFDSTLVAVMSSASSAVTYTFVYTDSEPGRVLWGANEEPQDPDYVPEPIYPEYIPLEDEHEFLAKEQPLPLVVSPTAKSPGYVVESDPEEDSEEYEDDKTEDGPVDYPMDGGEDGDDDDGDSSRDDADDEDEDKEDEDKEEEKGEHLAPADSAASISLPLEAEVERLQAMPTPPPSPPISLSPPSAGERLARCMAPSAHSSPLPVPSPLLPSSGCPTQIQTLRIASTQAFVDAATAALPSPPLPPLPPSLYIPSPVDCKDDIPESERPPLKRSCSFALGSSTLDAEERRRGISEVGYGIRDTWVDPAEAVPEIAPMTVGEDSRTRISQRLTMDSQWVGLLMKDRMTLQETVLIMQHAEMAELQEIDRRCQAQMVETLRVMRYIRREIGDMQAELLALRGQQRARKPKPDARVPDHQDAFRDADSHI